MHNLINTRERAEEFDAVVTYLNAVSAGLSFAEQRDVAGALHELVLRRKSAGAGSVNAAQRHGGRA